MIRWTHAAMEIEKARLEKPLLDLIRLLAHQKAQWVYEGLIGMCAC